MGPVERPWVLEVWEVDPDLAEETWRTWSTYMSEVNANDRRDKLAGKGYTVRVTRIGSSTAAAPPSVRCGICDEIHSEPFDGSCLI